MIQQSERLTPDSRFSNQQRSHGSLTPGITNSPDLPPTPPPLTIQPQNLSHWQSSSSSANYMPATTIVSTTSMNPSSMQSMKSASFETSTSIQMIPHQTRISSPQNQQQLYSNMSATPTPPPASPSLNLQNFNQTEHLMNSPSQVFPSSPDSIVSHSSNYQNTDQIMVSKGAEDKSDEQKKNDLINEKLFKLNSFQGSKGQAPARQKSIEKGSETQKIKTKKLKERHSAINPSRDANDGSTAAIIKQELSNDTVCLSNPQGKSSTYISLESNDIKTEDQLNQNHKYHQGTKTVTFDECFTKSDQRVASQIHFY